MPDQKRAYTKRRRAELEDETRRRITESAVELHGSLGPARTSMSAVAARAGVQRSTLYRHFPDENALLGACSAHWGAANPLPDPATWAAVEDPEARLRMALDDLYAFFRRNEQMLANLIRDASDVPMVGHLMGGFRDYFAAVRQVLLENRDLRGAARRRAHAAIGHALSFATWRSLVREQELTDAQAAELMVRLVDAAR